LQIETTPYLYFCFKDVFCDEHNVCNGLSEPLIWVIDRGHLSLNLWRRFACFVSKQKRWKSNWTFGYDFQGCWEKPV